MDEVKKTNCYITGPSAPEFSETRRLVHELAIELGFATVSSDTIVGVASIWEAIQSAIEHCDIAIADVSNSRPVVLYELGWLHALRKPVVLIMRHDDKPIFLLYSHYIVFYDPTQLADLRANIRAILQRRFTTLVNPRAGEA